MTYRRRGIAFLNTMIAMMPLITAIAAIGYQVSKRTMQLQVATKQEMATEAMIRDLVRRIQHDAARADQAQVHHTATGNLLDLVLAGRTVTYRTTTSGMTRVEKPDAGREVSFSWSLVERDISFHVERVGASRQVVWITVKRPVPVDRGPLVTRQLAAAAAVGRGGAT